MNIDKKYVIKRQDKDFVLYQGLLDAAHAAGLKAIRTRLVQPPLEVNGQTTIVSAEVEFQDAEGAIRVFTGIGDATPTNVGRNIAPHAVRMAETRAKARALRDALNIGAAALEELGGEDEPAAVPWYDRNGPTVSPPAKHPTAAELVEPDPPKPGRLVDAEAAPSSPAYRRAVAVVNACRGAGIEGVPDVPKHWDDGQWTDLANQWQRALNSKRPAR